MGFYLAYQIFRTNGLYIHTRARTRIENRFLNPTPSDILTRASKLFRFLFGSGLGYAKDLFYSGIPVKVLRFMLYVWRGGIIHPFIFILA